MKNMKLITEAWKRFVNEGYEEEDEYPYPKQTPEEEEEDRKAVNRGIGNAIKLAYESFQNSSSERAVASGGWIHSLRDLGEKIHKVRGFSSLQHGTRPFDKIIDKHLDAIKPDTDKKAYLEGTIKRDPAILDIVNDALHELGQPKIEAEGITESDTPGHQQSYYTQSTQRKEKEIADLKEKERKGTLTGEEADRLYYLQRMHGDSRNL